MAGDISFYLFTSDDGCTRPGKGKLDSCLIKHVLEIPIRRKERRRRGGGEEEERRRLRDKLMDRCMDGWLGMSTGGGMDEAWTLIPVTHGMGYVLLCCGPHFHVTLEIL